MSTVLFSEVEDFCHDIRPLNLSYAQATTSVHKGGGKYVYVDDKKKIDFTRLDYLALGNSSEVRDIMHDCIKKYDIACPASQIIQRTDAIENLEKELASLHGLKNAITFLSGYSANINIISLLGARRSTPHFRLYAKKLKWSKAIATQKTAFFIDSESHYSIILAAKQVKSLVGDKCLSFTYAGNDHEDLRRKIEAFEKKNYGTALKVIVSDSVSSTTGRIFDVERLCKIAKEYDATLYLDEAHAVGVIGDRGGGVSSLYDDFDQYQDRVIIMGTLTKAVAQLGGYAAFDNPLLTAYFKMLSPQYIFSTTVPPWMAAAIIKVIGLVKGDFGKQRRRLLHSRAECLRKFLRIHDFNILQSNTQIISVLVRNDDKVAEVQNFLADNGIIASLFKFPAVPNNSALIRFSICADIGEEEIDQVGRLMVVARDKIRF
jgi:8-amino-7-oxononanoate synthase